MPGKETIDVAAIAGAIGGLKAEVASLTSTTSKGFEGINARLDRQNGRIGKVENTATRIEATMVTTAICEGLRNAADRFRSATWKSYIIPAAVGVTVGIALRFIG